MILFSLPVHERIDIINNQIQNIFKYNPDSKIILHVNISYKDFDESIILKHPNVFINSKRFHYNPGKGLLWIHTQNFFEAIRLNINFEYFALLASNEMFIRNGLYDYVKKNKNGIQLVEFNKENLWHNFHKNLENDDNMINLLNRINLHKFYGGQAEGNFFEKNVFSQIVDIYINVYCSYKLKNANFYEKKVINEKVNFYEKKVIYDKEDNNIQNYINNNIILDTIENEEIILQTIFASLSIENYTIPFTLQNYTNHIDYTIEFINNLLNNKVTIQDNTHRAYFNVLRSPHIGKNVDTIFSIKKVDRTMNELRLYLTNK